MRDHDVIDAEFEVIEPAPLKPRKRRLFQGWWFDWRNFLIVGALSAAAAAKVLLAEFPFPR